MAEIPGIPSTQTSQTHGAVEIGRLLADWKRASIQPVGLYVAQSVGMYTVTWRA